uniref:Olfactory receptor family 52 subfamily H member 2 n=1 Tax=Nannospalax galili TaxID=1026970 RepID=A0A8C6RVR6_NANGA
VAMHNMSSDNTGPFTLSGIPGLEQYHVWISIPFHCIYLVAIVGNSILLYLITKISLPGCLTQLFFLHCSFVLDFAILLAMAIDRYVAICLPLRYTTILTPKTIITITVGISFRSFCVIVPCVFLVNRFPFSYWFAWLVCSDISINVWYGFCVPIMTVISDVILIGVSYTLILCVVFRLLPKMHAEGSGHLPAFFSIVAHRFGHDVPRTFHIIFANLYVIIPPVLNPVVYGVKTKQIRDKAILLLCPK